MSFDETLTVTGCQPGKTEMLGVVSRKLPAASAWMRARASPERDTNVLCLDFSHDHARSRAFRWGEDGIAGVSDTHCFQNVALAFWNEKE